MRLTEMKENERKWKEMKGNGMVKMGMEGNERTRKGRKLKGRESNLRK